MIVALRAVDGERAEGVDRVTHHVVAIEVARDFAVDFRLGHLGVANEIPRAGGDEAERLDAIGGVREKPLGAQLLERAVKEAVAVGRARGVALRDDEESHVMTRINELPPHVEPSLLLDLRNGSRTEVDVLSGAISRFGDEAGIDTPIHDTAALALVRVEGSH